MTGVVHDGEQLLARVPLPDQTWAVVVDAWGAVDVRPDPHPPEDLPSGAAADTGTTVT